MRLAVLSAAAAALAYLVGGLIPNYVNAAVAGLTALISIKPTFHDSAIEGVRQVIGTILGAGLGLILTLSMGYSPLAIFFTVLLCFGLAKLLKLGAEGAAVIGVTVIIVVGPFFNVDMVESRFFGVLLGSFVALVFSLWVRPGKPHRRALEDSIKYMKKSSTLLQKVSETLIETNGVVKKKTAKNWVLEAEHNMEQIAVAKRDATSALKAASWSPLIKKKEAEEVLEQIIMSQITARTTYNIVRDLYVAARKEQVLSSSVSASIAELLQSTAEVIAHQGSQSINNPAEGLTSVDTKIIDIEEKHEAASAKVKKLDETQSIMIAGSLMRDAEKIKDVLTEEKSED